MGCLQQLYHSCDHDTRVYIPSVTTHFCAGRHDMNINLKVAIHQCPIIPQSIPPPNSRSASASIPSWSIIHSIALQPSPENKAAQTSQIYIDFQKSLLLGPFRYPLYSIYLALIQTPKTQSQVHGDLQPVMIVHKLPHSA